MRGAGSGSGSEMDAVVLGLDQQGLHFYGVGFRIGYHE